MKLSISNIAWSAEYDYDMHNYISKTGFSGLEIAPTRILPENPYDKLDAAKRFSDELKTQYNLDISSMQSIWFGKTENLFGSAEERRILIDYTKKAIDFAAVVNCKNLVFGSPKNRIIENDDQYPLAVSFFRELGDYAYKNRTVLSIEPNPSIYGTNFINNTNQAFELTKIVKSKGFMVNIDLGTIIQNNESLRILDDNTLLINHVHISEPNLATIEKRAKHIELAELLANCGYNNFVSIEMKNMDSIVSVKHCIQYIKRVFHAN